MFLSNFLGGIDSTGLLALLIILCALFFEDFTTIVVGILASDGLINIPLAFLCLFTGVVLGDMTWYVIGALARNHPRLAQYIDHDFTAPFRSWLELHYKKTVFLGHFIPGLRSTSYTASGFFRRPFPTFMLASLPSAFILTTTLFTVSFWFGSITTKWVSHARWGIALVFFLALFFIGRHNIRLYQAKKTELTETHAP